MAKIVTMGELIVEIMRDREDSPLGQAGYFRGPFPSGAPAIFIDAASRLGLSSALISGVGDDAFGHMMLERLAEDGVDVSNVIVDGSCSTGCAFVSYDSSGDRSFIFHIGNTPAVKGRLRNEEILDDTAFFHIMGCSVMSERAFGESIVGTMKKAVSKGARVSFDPNIRPELMKDPSVSELMEEILKETAVFLPGLGELMKFTGKDTEEEAVKSYFDIYPKMKYIVVKNGKHGAMCHERDNTTAFGVYEIEPVDATGAGDTFDATFLVSLLLGKDSLEALRNASAAAAINTAAFGPMEGRVTWEKIEKMKAGKVE